MFSLIRWLSRALLLVVAIYIVMVGLFAYVVTRPPDEFGQIMKHVPPVLAFGILPGQRMFTWARAGQLQEGDPAPDFTLHSLDRTGAVSLSSFRGSRPVVLVFGSYT